MLAAVGYSQVLSFVTAATLVASPGPRRPREEAQAHWFDSPSTYTLVTAGPLAGTGPAFGGRAGLSVGRLWAASRGVVVALGGRVDYTALRVDRELAHQGLIGSEARFGGARGPWFFYALLAVQGGVFAVYDRAWFSFSLTAGAGFVRHVGRRLLIGTELAPRLESWDFDPAEMFGTLEWRFVLGGRF